MTLSSFLENWGNHQDYGWFLAALGWSYAFAGFCSRAHWRATAPWLAGFAAVNLAMPMLEMSAFTSANGFGSSASESQLAQRFAWDLLLGAAQPLGAVFLAMAGVSLRSGPKVIPRRRQLMLFGAGLLVAEALGVWRSIEPIWAGVAAAVLGTAVAGWMIRVRLFQEREPERYWAAGLTFWTLLAFFATSGPLAYALNEGRRNFDSTAFALPAQLISLLAAVCLATAVWRTRLRAGTADSLWGEVRNALWLLAAWLVFGLVFIQWSGGREQRNYESSLLQRARLMTVYLEQSALDDALAPAFQIGKVDTRLRHGTDILTYSRVNYALRPSFGRLREQLRLAQEINRDFWDVSLLVLRDGWLAVAIKWPDDPAYHTEILLSHPSAEWQVKSRETPGGFVLHPTREPWGYMVHAVVPVPSAAPGAPLGWLDIEVDVTDWAAAFNLVRFQAMSVLLVGVLLWTTGVGLRLRYAHQSAAEAQAATAVASEQAKGILLANVSHELRTPLQSILGYCDLLQSEVTTARGRDRLAVLRQHGKIMARVVNDLLDLSAIESGAVRFEVKPADLRRLVGEVVDDFRPAAAAKQLGLQLTLDPAFPDWVLIDAERVHQIAANLISNAVKFTAAGRVTVALHRVNTDAAGGSFELAVADTGPGISAEEQTKLFKPFSRLAASRGHEGSGLGLALSAALCQKAGGELRVESDGRSGSRFLARFPLRVAVAPAGANAGRPVSLQGRRILVADDNPLIRELFVAHLTDGGVACDQAEDGGQALTLARSGRYDAVVLDLGMPVMDGFTVAAQLRADPGAQPQLLLVGVSAHAGREERERAMQAGFDSFLVKPVDLAELSAVLALPRRSTRSGLRKELMELFQAEVPAQAAALAGLLWQRDWPAVHARAHYLKSSAVVVQDDALYEACGALEEAASRSDPAAVRVAWRSCLHCLAPVLGEATCARLASLADTGNS